jgi:hypothetical protein
MPQSYDHAVANSQKVSSWLLLIPVAVAAGFLIFGPAIQQDESYHQFADQRTMLGIPNFWNVVSNFGFAIVGAMGLFRFRDWTSRILFLGVLLTAAGSAFYHWAPDDARLVWDRLPMTVVFMALLSMVIRIWFDERLGGILLAPLLIFGIATIYWWRSTGDLKPYGVAQFGPMLVLLPAMFFSRTVRGLWPVLVLYAIAKLGEQYDGEIYRWAVLSGHTWKHLFAALATYGIFRWRAALGLI